MILCQNQDLKHEVSAVRVCVPSGWVLSSDRVMLLMPPVLSFACGQALVCGQNLVLWTNMVGQSLRNPIAGFHTTSELICHPHHPICCKWTHILFADYITIYVISNFLSPLLWQECKHLSVGFLDSLSKKANSHHSVPPWTWPASQVTFHEPL